MLKKQKGFTLIEMLIVIFVISILATLITVNLSDARKRGRDTRRKEDLKTLASALELYNQDNSSYPTTLVGASSTKCYYYSNGSGQTGDGTNGSTCQFNKKPWIPAITGKYVAKIPVDPINSSAAKTNPTKFDSLKAGTSGVFIYTYSSFGDTVSDAGDYYELVSFMENTLDASEVYGSGFGDSVYVKRVN